MNLFKVSQHKLKKEKKSMKCVENEIKSNFS